MELAEDIFAEILVDHKRTMCTSETQGSDIALTIFLSNRSLCNYDE